MSATAYSTRILRRYDFLRFRLGLVRGGIYAGGLFALSLVLALLARASLLSFLPYSLGEGSFGIAYLCMILSLAASALWLIIDPRPLMLDTLRSNALNLYYKLGSRPRPLALVRPSVVLWGLLRVYLTAFALSALAGLALGGLGSVADILIALLLGLCGIITLVCPALLTGAISFNRLLSSLTVALSAGVFFAALRISGALAPLDGLSFADAGYLKTLLLPLVVALISALLGGAGVMLCSKKLVRYDEEELDDDDLMSLGVTEDIAVYTRGGNRCTVVISGAELMGGEGTKPPDFIIDDDGSLRPAASRAAANKPAAKINKKRAAKKHTGKKTREKPAPDED